MTNIWNFILQTSFLMVCIYSLWTIISYFRNKKLSENDINHYNQKEFSNFDYEDLKNMTELYCKDGKFYFKPLYNVWSSHLSVSSSNDRHYNPNFEEIILTKLPTKAKTCFVRFEIWYEEIDDKGNKWNKTFPLAETGKIKIKLNNGETKEIDIHGQEAEISLSNTDYENYTHKKFEFNLILDDDSKIMKLKTNGTIHLSLYIKWFSI
jgi:hypothetical protein